jgi:hypothetical protein
MSSFFRFALAVSLMAFGTFWLLCFAAPALIGVPVTWANAPLLIVTIPTFGAYAAAFSITRY